MVRMAAAAGTSDIIATPHANEQFHFEPQAVKQQVAELQSAAGECPRIHGGCELHVTPENLAAALERPAQFTLAGRSYLLVEFSDFLIPKTAGAILSRLLDGGIRPIVAHPERNPILRTRMPELASWVEQGCFLQVTAQSPLGRHGRTAKTAAEELLHRGMVHFLASDAHDLEYRPPVLEAAWQFLERGFGREVAQRLLVDNPRAALAGDPLEAVVPMRRKRSRFALW